MTQLSHSSLRRSDSAASAVKSPAGLKEATAFALFVCVAAWIVISFHDVFWWPPDEGAYAHVAGRILAGEVLNRDIQDLHAGYINFVNALAFALFGERLVAMRYPLAVLTLLQAVLVFGLLRPRGPIVAATGAIGMAALTFVQFLNPTAHWYALFMLVAIIAALSWIPRRSRWRLPVVGFLLVTLLMFRQLTGVLVAIGVLTYWLCEGPSDRSAPHRFRDLLLARILLVIMGLGVAGYLRAKTDPGAAILFGAGPLSLILWALAHDGRANRDVVLGLTKLASGGLLAAVPLLLYHLAHGSVTAWYNDAFVAAIGLTDLPFFDRARYVNLLMLALATVLSPSGPAAFANGTYWIVLTLLAAVTGTLTLRALWLKGRQSGMRPYALPVIGSFYALVAVHYQIPIYLLYTVAISLAGLLCLAAERGDVARYGAVGLAAFLSAVGLHYQAGQPVSRGIAGIVAGQRAPAPVASGLARAGLQISADDAAAYRDLIDLIRRETPDGAAILALPGDPELYFLSGRRNPTRFYSSALGIPDDGALRDVLEILRRDPPRLVFFRPDDKYNTAQTARLMDFVRARYEALAPRAGFEIYRYRPPSPRTTRRTSAR